MSTYNRRCGKIGTFLTSCQGLFFFQDTGVEVDCVLLHTSLSSH